MTIPPWSYSSLSCFENCPKQYYHRYILKEREPETEVMLHGTRVHKALEDRVKEPCTPLPEAYLEYEPLAASIQKAAQGKIVYTELELAVRKDFTPCGFWDKNVWGRGKADLVLVDKPQAPEVAWVGDWKTGKVREKVFQVQIFAGFLFKMMPTLKRVFANNIWLQAGKIGELYRFEKERGEQAIWQDIIQKVQRVELAFERGAFDAKPSGLCGYCSVKSCKYNRS